MHEYCYVLRAWNEHGETLHVYMNIEDARRLAAYLAEKFNSQSEIRRALFHQE